MIPPIGAEVKPAGSSKPSRESDNASIGSNSASSSPLNRLRPVSESGYAQLAREGIWPLKRIEGIR
jgi:hypothetical protein